MSQVSEYGQPDIVHLEGVEYVKVYTGVTDCGNGFFRNDAIYLLPELKESYSIERLEEIMGEIQKKLGKRIRDTLSLISAPADGFIWCSMKTEK